LACCRRPVQRPKNSKKRKPFFSITRILDEHKVEFTKDFEAELALIKQHTEEATPSERIEDIQKHDEFERKVLVLQFGAELRIVREEEKQYTSLMTNSNWPPPDGANAAPPSMLPLPQSIGRRSSPTVHSMPSNLNEFEFTYNKILTLVSCFVESYSSHFVLSVCVEDMSPLAYHSNGHHMAASRTIALLAYTSRSALDPWHQDINEFLML
jgi:hypothetical protein